MTTFVNSSQSGTCSNMENQSEAVKLLIFPFSLCDKAKTWFNELNEESITSWEHMRRAFINRFFPPSLFNHRLLEIRSFSQSIQRISLTGFPAQSVGSSNTDVLDSPCLLVLITENVSKQTTR
ncbi:reverse transcriptase domain-containing protein, partial [Tanacetum coccineum]